MTASSGPALDTTSPLEQRSQRSQSRKDSNQTTVAKANPPSVTLRSFSHFPSTFWATATLLSNGRHYFLSPRHVYKWPKVHLSDYKVLSYDSDISPVFISYLRIFHMNVLLITSLSNLHSRWWEGKSIFLFFWGGGGWDPPWVNNRAVAPADVGRTFISGRRRRGHVYLVIDGPAEGRTDSYA